MRLRSTLDCMLSANHVMAAKFLCTAMWLTNIRNDAQLSETHERVDRGSIALPAFGVNQKNRFPERIDGHGRWRRCLTSAAEVQHSCTCLALTQANRSLPQSSTELTCVM